MHPGWLQLLVLRSWGAMGSLDRVELSIYTKSHSGKYPRIGCKQARWGGRVPAIGERGGPFSHMCMLCTWCAEPTQLISNTHHAPTPSTDYLQASPKARQRGALCKCGPQTPPPTPLTADYRSTAVQARPHTTRIGPDTRCGSGWRQMSPVSRLLHQPCKRSEWWL